MSAQFQVIPVEGVTELPELPVRATERPRSRAELILLNVTAAIAVLVVSCAWILLALD